MKLKAPNPLPQGPGSATVCSHTYKYNLTSFDHEFIHYFSLFSHSLKNIRKHYLHNSLWEFEFRSRGTIVACAMVWIFQEIWDAQSCKGHKNLRCSWYAEIWGNDDTSEIKREDDNLIIIFVKIDGSSFLVIRLEESILRLTI